MRSIPTGWLAEHVTSLQVCWVIVRRDGEIIRGTECDQNITIATGSDYAGTYLAHAAITGSDIRSTDDMAVDNLEIKGALQDTTGLDSSDIRFDLNAADLEAGMFDNAEVTTFLVSADDPDAYQHVSRTGWIGNTRRTAEGSYTAEVRGLTQALSQTIVRTYGVSCDAELFDARCGLSSAGFIVTDFVLAVIVQRRIFTVSEALFPGLSTGGKITFTSGQNAGYSMEIKSTSGAQVELYLPMPKDITGGGVDVGDGVTYQAGCDKKYATCQLTYNNLVNFRGHGHFVPGESEILKVGKR